MNVSRWLNQTITYKTKSSPDVNGDYTLSGAATLAARVERRNFVLRTGEDTERVASHVIYTATEIPTGAQVWVPGADTGDDSEAREVLETGSSPALHNTTTILCKAILG